MKSLNSVVFALTVGCAFAISSHATILVNDTWIDGERFSSGPDGTGIDSPWFCSSTSLLTATAGTMTAATPASGSMTFLTYFAPDATPATLIAYGDELKITWTFTPFGLNANNTSQGFNFGVANTPTAALLTVDGTSPGTPYQYYGYAMFSNMGRTLGNGNPFWMKKWGGTASDFLAHQGNYTAVGANGTSGNHGYDNGVSYTYVFDAKLNALGGLDITSTMTGGTLGGGLNGVGYMTISYTDPTPSTLSFDTFCVRPSASSNTFSTLDTTLFKVELIPEPSTFVLGGLGLLGLVGLRRLRR